MAEHRGKSITSEDVLHLIDSMGNQGDEKFRKRQEEFTQWITDFIGEAKKATLYPEGTQLINQFDEKKVSVYLTFLHFELVETYVRMHLKGKDVINHYKIAAITEYVIMKYPPFESETGDLTEEVLAVNADFAFFVVLQIIISWNIDKPDFNADVVDYLITEDENTRAFIDEHKMWLMHTVPSVFHSVILSNMQTLRLLHYWFREPKDGDKFKSHT